MVRYCFTHGFGPYAPEDLAGPLACKQRCVSSLSHHNVPKEKRSTLPIPLIQSLVNRRRTPGAPEFSQQEKEDATACKIAISRGESPETLLRSRLESGTSSRPAAAVCLLEADEKSHINGNLGQITLNWLWDQRSDLIYPDDNDRKDHCLLQNSSHGDHDSDISNVQHGFMRSISDQFYLNSHRCVLGSCGNTVFGWLQSCNALNQLIP